MSSEINEYEKLISIKARNYKSFGDTFEGIESYFPVNIIIGRNNTGKSALLDVLEEEFSSNGNFWSKTSNPVNREIAVSFPVDEEFRKNFFSLKTAGGVGWPVNVNHQEASKRLQGQVVNLVKTGSKLYHFIDSQFHYEVQSIIGNTNKELNKCLPYLNKRIRRISAERDIRPEGTAVPPPLEPNGEGATKLLHYFFLHYETKDIDGEVLILEALNEIFNPDSTFSAIKLLDVGHMWEIYLTEKLKGKIPLKDSGSGFKTVLLVLANVLLIPKLERKPLSDYIFLFEELENNLHPALLRRLFSFITRIAKEEGSTFFITTHSNIVIDQFSRNSLSQILHVSHNGKNTSVNKVDTYVKNKTVLDDLDVRASDLLQSNCIVWVEGPSDRLYFNRWVEVFTGGKLKEGVHYQCVFYGGRLLAHLSGEFGESGVSILKANRNSIVIADGDKRKTTDPISKSKLRLANEITRNNGLAWITKKREIENYIPVSALMSLFNKKNVETIKALEKFSDYLEHINSKEGASFLRNKVVFAERVIPHIKKSDLQLDNEFLKIIKQIAKWNKVDL